MKNIYLTITIFFIILFLIPWHIQAKEFQVADGRQLFLAFSEASDNGENDIIFLAAGVYKGEFIFETSEAKSLTLTAESGLKPEQVIFDGEDMVRPLYFVSDVVSDVEVRNISIRNGNIAEKGGGIYINIHGNVNFFYNIVSNNSGKNGGGVYIQTVQGKNITIKENVIKDNIASYSSGGVCVSTKGNISIINNSITENTSTFYAGGIYAESENLSIINNTIKNNFASTHVTTSQGGGIYACARSDLKISRNNVINNFSFHNGGGIYAYGIYGNITINNNNVTENKSYGFGTGIYAKTPNGNISLYNNKVSENISQGYIAGIYILQTQKIDMVKNTISNNICTSAVNDDNRGAGIYLANGVKKVILTDNIIKNNTSKTPRSNDALRTYNTGSLILTNNTIIQNKSNAIESHNASAIDINSNIIKGNSGCGIRITSSSENSVTCTIRNNIVMNFNNSSDEGGGIYVDNFQLLEIHQNVVANNQAGKGAGLFLSPTLNLFMNNNTIASNTAKEHGGGLYVKTSYIQGSLLVDSNIFWNNTAAIEGDDIYLHGFGANPRRLYTNNIREISGKFEDVAGNFSSNPLFYSPETGDYHLRPDSPCINKGNRIYISDQSGTLFLQSGDVGAYEYNPTIPHPADTNVNFVIEESEYNAYNNAWRNNLPWAGSPENIPIEYNTRAGFLVENGGAYTNTGAMKPLCWTPNP